MMRPIVFQVAPPAPSNLGFTVPATGKFRVVLTWMDNSASETAFTLQRATDSLFSQGLTAFTIAASSPNTAYGGTMTFTDTTASKGKLYYYRVAAIDDFTPASPLAAPFAAVPLASAWSNTVTLAQPVLTLSPTSLKFGNQAVNTTSAAQTATVSNTGSASLSITSISLGGTNANQFQRASSPGTCPAFGSPGTLPAGASCTVNLQFRPTTTGSKAAALNVNVAAPAVSGAVALTGTGK